MSENYLKSRLKRKKVSVERGNRNQPPGQEPVRSPATPNTDGEEMRPSPESPALGGSPAGRRETQNLETRNQSGCGSRLEPDLTAVEILWALTLEAYLSQTEKQNQYQVPELPGSPTESSPSVTEANRHCRHICGDGPPSSPAQTRAPPELGDTRNIKTASPHDHRAEQSVCGPEPAAVLQTCICGPEPAAVLQTSVCGPEPAAVLQTCPMCCLRFPSGLSQMDQDGHLAQCLSEVRTDVSW